MTRIFKTFSWLFIITFIVRLLDVVKNLIIASKVGVSGSADVFFALQFIPEYLVVLLGIDTLKGVVNSEYSTLNQNRKSDIVNKSFANIFSYLFVLSLLLSVLILIFRNEMISLFLPGLSNESYQTAVMISVFIFPVFFFKSIITLIHPYLNSNRKYYLPVITQIILTLSIIFFIYFPVGNKELVYNISIGFIVGNFLYLVIIFLPVYPVLLKNIKNFFKFNDVTRKIIKGCLTLLLLSVVNQLYLFSRNYIASYFPEGSLSSISYGYSIPYFVSTFTFNVVFSVLLTHLSSVEEKSDNTESPAIVREKLIFNTMFSIYYLYIPIVILFVTFSEKILTIVFMRGNFDLDGIEMTAKPFIWESLSLMTYLLYIIPVILYLSLKQYKKLMIIGSTSFFLGILLNYLSSLIFGYYGISVGNFITMGIYGAVLFFGLRENFPNFRINAILFARIMISFIISAVLIYFLKDLWIFNYSGKFIIFQILNLITNFIVICIVSLLMLLIFNKIYTTILIKDIISKISNRLAKRKIIT